MEKTIEQANKSLLKKRQQSQDTKKDQGLALKDHIQSRIKNGEIDVARKEASMVMHTLAKDLREEIMDLFRKAESGSFVCIRCRKERSHQFHPIFLRYVKTRVTCDDCQMKVTEEEKEKATAERAVAMEDYVTNFDDAVSGIMAKCNVPAILLDAQRADIDEPLAESLKCKQSYFITGDVGVGKTYLAVVLLRMYLQGVSPTYVSRNELTQSFVLDILTDDMPVFREVPELLLQIRETYSDRSEHTESEIVDYYANTPFLILDDLGTEKVSEFSTLMLYLIINRRSTRGLTTIITSNLSIDEIQDRLSNRISSRIRGMCKIIGIGGTDRRFDN